MASKSRFFTLQPSEMAIFRGACDIYAAYISAGRVDEGQEMDFMRKAITETVSIAQAVEEHIDSDEEMAN